MVDNLSQINNLLLEIKYGDTSKMSELYDLTFNYLKYVALAYVNNKQDCEDALNESYYRVLKYIKSFKTFNNGYNWLCSIVKNEARRINYENYKISLNDIEEEDGFYYCDEIEDMLAKDEFYQFVKTLSKRDRQFVYYRFILDMSYGQIAKKLKCSRVYSYKRINVILDKLRKIVD